MLVGVKWHPTLVWICIAPVTSDGEHVFTCLLAIDNVVFREKKSFAHFLIGLFIILLLGFKNPLYSLDIRLLPGMNYKYFLPVCRLFFHFFDNALWGIKVLNFDEVQLIYFLLLLLLVLMSSGSFKAVLVVTTTTTTIVASTDIEGESHRRISEFLLC